MNKIKETDKAILVSKQDDGYIKTLWVPKSIIKDNKIPEWFFKKAIWEVKECLHPLQFRTNKRYTKSDGYQFFCTRCTQTGWDE